MYMLTVRGVERGDADELAAIHVAAWLAAYRGLMSDAFLDNISVERWQASWTERLSGDELPPVRAAIHDVTLMGFCITAAPGRDEDAANDVAEIVAMNVRPQSWRLGAGTALMNDALDRFGKDGWREVVLWVVDGNDRAQAFYRRFGFVPDGARTTHEPSGATEVRMRLALTAPAAG